MVEQMPPNGEYDVNKAIIALKDAFNKAYEAGFSEQLSQKILEKNQRVSRVFVINSTTADSYRYTLTVFKDPQHTHYKIEANERGDMQGNYENDLFSTVGEIGKYYDNILFGYGHSNDDYTLSVERMIGIKMKNDIKSAEAMMEVAIILNLLEPAEQ